MAPYSETPVTAHRKTKAAPSKAAAETATVKARKVGKHQQSLGEDWEEELEAVVAAEIPEPAPPGKKQKKDNKKTEQPTIQLQAPVPSPPIQLVEIPGDILKDGAKISKKKQAMALRAAQGIKLENGKLIRTEDTSAKLSKKEQASILGISRKNSHAKAKAVVPVEESEVEREEIEEEDDLIPMYRTFHSGGGKFLPIAPAFSKDEQYIFLALPHALRVYSTKTSLLNRIFNIPGSNHDLPPTSEKRIVSYCLDPANENQVFVTTYSGKIFLWNWAEGELMGKWDTDYDILLMEACADEEVIAKDQKKGDLEKVTVGKRVVYLVAQPRDQLLVKNKNQKEPEKGPSKESTETPRKSADKKAIEKHKNHKSFTDQLIEKELKKSPWGFFQTFLEAEQTKKKSISGPRLRKLHKVPGPVTSFKVLAKGTLIVAISGHTLWIGNKSRVTEEEQKGVWGTWRFYTVDSEISCMDVNVLDVNLRIDKKGEQKGDGRAKGYVAVGDVKGQIYMWHNILNHDSHGEKLKDMRRLHWHRNVVGSVQFSKDGNYLISGGNETVLVLWQIDTGHKEFLPHLTSAIEHIVVSPSGTSYGIRLSDNSVMVLSTTELKPKANIAGIQAASLPVYLPSQPDASLLTANDILQQEENDGVPELTSRLSAPRVPCAIHPTQSSQLLLATSSHSTSSLLITPEAATAESCPYLQTYDIFSDRPVAKQALTRTHATDVKIGPSGNSLVEPNVRLLSVSKNGEWLASLDEWSPPMQDTYDHALLDPSTPTPGGREVFLKFWRKDNAAWDLVTRVDSPHPDTITTTFNGGAKVLDLVALPSAKNAGFATLGADGCVRIWKARVRTRGGVVVKHKDLEKGGVKSGEDIVQVNWGCRKVIHFVKGNAIASTSSSGALAVSYDGSVLAVAVNVVEATTATASPGASTSSTIYVLDPATGLTLHTLLGLQPGSISSLRIIDRNLVILGTNKLIVFDLVRGRVKWELPIMRLLQHSENPRPEELFMDADMSKGTIAVGVNFQLASGKEEVTLFGRREENEHCQWGLVLSVFDLAYSKPLPVFNTVRIGVAMSALKAVPIPAEPTGVGSGYLYLDSFARVNYLTPSTIAVSQPASAAVEAPPPARGLSAIYAAPPVREDEYMIPEDVEVDLDMRTPVSSEMLSNVLFEHVGTTSGEGGVVESMQMVYGMMDLAEVFERVMGLYARPPLQGDEEEGKGEGEEEGDRMEIDG
ncbi:hypothetical protein BGX38DRAFT_1139073 [Terfezia claveryi]|nr:hypothetical protein BGX38DRAFT_1139073 [Terfezia claveryi]